MRIKKAERLPIRKVLEDLTLEPTNVIGPDHLSWRETDIESTRDATEKLSLLTLDWLKERNAKSRLKKAWKNRNLNHGEVFMDTLDIPKIIFQQNIFIEETQEIVDKLYSIGFIELKGFPDEGLFEHFCYILYSEKHNIAISLYKKEIQKTLLNVIEIAEHFTDYLTSKEVFVTTMEVLNDART